MPTRLKKPSLWRSLAVAGALVAFQGYLGYNALRGQFGIENHGEMLREIERLEARSAALAAEVGAYRHRVDLFNTLRLDPDLVTERARALLGMAQPGDVVFLVDRARGLPLSGSFNELAADQLTDLIANNSDI